MTDNETADRIEAAVLDAIPGARCIVAAVPGTEPQAFDVLVERPDGTGVGQMVGAPMVEDEPALKGWAESLRGIPNAR